MPLPGAWAYRNERLTGQQFVSTISTYNLLMYRAADIEAARQHASLEVLQLRLLQFVGDVQFFDDREAFASRLAKYKSLAHATLSSEPLAVARQTSRGCVRVLFGPGTRSLDAMLRQPDLPASWWSPLYSGILVLIAAGSLLGAWKLGRNGVMLGVLALYFVVLAGGPEGNSRFRVPVTPLLAVLSVAGVNSLRKRK